MENLCHYKLKDYNEMTLMLKQDRNLWSYINKVYGKLMNLKRGEKLYIPSIVKPVNLEKFIKICHMFIDEQKPFSEYTFNETCTEIRRYNEKEGRIYGGSRFKPDTETNNTYQLDKKEGGTEYEDSRWVESGGNR